jgi:hypothetical protein
MEFMVRCRLTVSSTVCKVAIRKSGGVIGLASSGLNDWRKPSLAVAVSIRGVLAVGASLEFRFTTG